MTDTSHSDSTQSDDEARGDDRPVPLAALEAERDKRQALERQVAELQGRVTGMASAAPAQPAQQQRVFSNAELDGLVQDGKISAAEAQDVRDKQLEDRLARRYSADVAQRDRSTSIQSELERYTRAKPEIDQPGTADRDRIQKEFTYMVDKLGMQNNDATALAAARNVLGPIDALEAASRGGRRTETHEETGGGGGGGRDAGGGGQAANALPKDLTTRERAYYQEMINKKMATPEQVAKMHARSSRDIARRADATFGAAGTSPAGSSAA